MSETVRTDATPSAPAAPPGRDAGTAGPVSLKTIALPVEHGGWGFVIEAMMIGMVAAPGIPAAGLALAALGAFLARHPAKLALGDLLRHRRLPRTRWAAWFVLGYGVIAVGGLALAATRAVAPFWLPLAIAAGLALVQLDYDARLRGRERTPELLGCAAPGAIASAAFLAAGLHTGFALAVWLILAARAAASVLYVRSRLRLDRGLPHAPASALLAHLAALGLVTVLAGAGLGPWLALPTFALLLARAVHGLSGRRRIVRPQVLGLRELAFGLAAAGLLAVGYRFGI